MGFDPDDCQYTYRKFAQRNAGAGFVDPFFDPWAEIERLRAALKPFVARGELLKVAGAAALPDDVSAHFLKLDGLQAKHFRNAATAYQQQGDRGK